MRARGSGWFRLPKDRLFLTREELMGGAQSLRSAREAPPTAQLLCSGDGPGDGGAGPGGAGSRPRPRPPHGVGAGSRVGSTGATLARGALWLGCWCCLARREEWAPGYFPEPLGSWEPPPPALHRSGPWPCPARGRTPGYCTRPAGTASAVR